MTNDTNSFDLQRTLPIKQAKLWEIMTDPLHREKWGAPEEGMVLTMENSDLRVGGAERHRCGPADAPDFVVDTRWYHLDAPQRAAFTETVVIGGETLFTSLVTYLLVPDGASTNLYVTVALSSFCGPEAAQETKGGWEGGLANLDRYVASMQAPA